ncbi:MAG: hypothetical protein ACT4OM_03510 [Actinomycetota bacterium]
MGRPASAAITSLVLLAGCSAPGLVNEAASPAEPVRSQLTTFFQERANRLEKGDLQGYLAALDPSIAESERMFATGAAAVPIQAFKIRVGQGTFPPGERIYRGVGVDLTYRYDGLPEDNEFRVAFNYDLVSDQDGWRITAASIRPGSHPPVWATGPVEMRRSEHFLALYRPDLEDPARIMQEAEQARAQLDGKITFPLEGSYLLILAREDEQYRTMSSAPLAAVSPIAQVETSYEVTPETIKVLSRQMVVNSTRLHEDGSALETLRHELGHLALAQVTRPFTPAWVSESAAMYLAGTRPVTVWRRGLTRGGFDSINIDLLTRSASLGEHNPSQVGASLEYAYSAACAWYLVETYGAERYWRFYSSYAEVPPAELYELLPEHTAGQQTDEAIKMLAITRTTTALAEIFALNTSQLDQRVREWMARQA